LAPIWFSESLLVVADFVADAPVRMFCKIRRPAFYDARSRDFDLESGEIGREARLRVT
jgi:hypothetical protein